MKSVSARPNDAFPNKINFDKHSPLRIVHRCGAGLALGSLGPFSHGLLSLQELEHLGVGFVSLTEPLDLTTPAGPAMIQTAGYSPNSNGRF
jgi:hypothetical protein